MHNFALHNEGSYRISKIFSSLMWWSYILQSISYYFRFCFFEHPKQLITYCDWNSKQNKDGRQQYLLCSNKSSKSTCFLDCFKANNAHCHRCMGDVCKARTSYPCKDNRQTSINFITGKFTILNTKFPTNLWH